MREERESTSTTLLARLRDRADEAAWSRFVDFCTPLLYYWSRRFGLAPEEASELVQEVFLVLVVKMPDFSYDRQGSFRGWLHTVFRNKWRELHRKERLAPSALPGDDLPDSDDALEALWEAEYRRSLVDRLARCVRGEFEPATWQAFWEVAARGRQPAEVAAELNTTVGAVYTAKSHVLRRLRAVADGLLD